MKRVWIGLIFFVAALSLGEARSADDFNIGSPAVVQDVLQRSYSKTNEKFFDGKLPANTKVYYVERGPGYIGWTFCAKQMGDSVSNCLIVISPRYNRSLNQAEMTELHEICHIATYIIDEGKHGPTWQACMKSLADRDAFEKSW